MSIYEILNLPHTARETEVKAKYMRMLNVLHPYRTKNKKVDEYLALTDAYNNFVRGDIDSINCYKFVELGTAVKIECRCGGLYFLRMQMGKYECDYCSCYVLVVGSSAKIHNHRENL